ncbi:MAG: hypothetical protein QOE61_93 [Micromonosporaceae bacterium]|jgi:hypothetical protein|nr:hypothetical protein [Micromonosporaceae bacterium]
MHPIRRTRHPAATSISVNFLMLLESHRLAKNPANFTEPVVCLAA